MTHDCLTTPALRRALPPQEAKDASGRTPLLRAGAEGHLELVKALLAAGANREAKAKVGLCKGRAGGRGAGVG